VIFTPPQPTSLSECPTRHCICPKINEKGLGLHFSPKIAKVPKMGVKCQFTFSGTGDRFTFKYLSFGTRDMIMQQYNPLSESEYPELKLLLCSNNYFQNENAISTFTFCKSYKFWPILIQTIDKRISLSLFNKRSTI
jgi:hypothetical protein